MATRDRDLELDKDNIDMISILTHGRLTTLYQRLHKINKYCSRQGRRFALASVAAALFPVPKQAVRKAGGSRPPSTTTTAFA